MTLTDAELATQMQQRSRSFDAWALEYDRYRPTYPQALFDHVVARLKLPDDVRVADLGAGTGKAARQMARRGWRVTAVEPGRAMLEVARARTDAQGLAIETLLAPAEETGLPDASFDLVTVAQAFHWFDKPRAVAEMARIVKPKGGAAVFWNARADDRSPFLAEYTELMAGYLPEAHVDRRTREDTAPHDLADGGRFAVDDRIALAHDVEMSSTDFVGLAFTASQVRLFVDEESKARYRDDILALIAAHFGAGPVVVPYDVDLYVGRRVR